MDKNFTSKGNEEMDLAWKFISCTGKSVFLTGKAGTGKTTFLKRLAEGMPKRMVVLAPTGVAAINAGGQTIHSFFQLAFGPFVPDGVHDAKNRFRMSEKKKALIRTLDLLVIDEVSMVRADLLDQIDDVLRHYKDRYKPFGGVQLLLIGDLMQLSPVSDNHEWEILSKYYATPYFFSSKALQQLDYITIELKKIYRQQDVAFIRLLADVRNGNMHESVVRALNERYIPNFNPQESGWIRITTHNRSAQEQNDMKLALLPGSPVRYDAEIEGNFPEMSYPADPALMLKQGAQVMFIKNDPSGNREYYNGLIGTVTHLSKTEIEVLVDNGTRFVKVAPVPWENTKYTIDPDTKAIKSEVEGTFTQFPLRLAWAITVHKSQGLTFERAMLDINFSFAHGQVYVALSRCRTLQGLVLMQPLEQRAIITDGRVNTYISAQERSMAGNAAKLPSCEHAYALALMDELYSFSRMQRDLQWLIRVVEEHLSRRYGELLVELKDTAVKFETEMVAVAEKFAVQYRAIMDALPSGDISDTPLVRRISESAVYFSKKINQIFTGLLKQCDIKIDNKQVAKTYGNAHSALSDTVKEKLQIFQALEEEEFSVSNYLNIKARAFLDVAGDVLAPSAAKKNNKDSRKRTKAPKSPKVRSADETLALFQRGFSISQIAAERGLTESTIYNHLTELVFRGVVHPNKVVHPQRAALIRRVLAGMEEGTVSESEFKEGLRRRDYTYDEIRFIKKYDKVL